MMTAGLRGLGAAPGYTADGTPYSATSIPTQVPTGAGWNQGIQPMPTLGMGGTALPVAAGDFTIPYTGGIPGGAVRPGIFVNSLGYTSQASLAASAAAIPLLQAAVAHGYRSTGEPALTQYASGALTPYLQNYTPPSNTLNNVAPNPVSVTPAPGTSALNPPVQNWFPLNPNQIANGTTGESMFDMSGATSWLQTNWMLVAGAIAAVVILPSVLGGKR